MSNEENSGQALATTDQSKAVAKAKARLDADGAGVMPIIPRNIEEAGRYAQGLISANQVPDSFRYDGKKANDVNASLVMMGVLKSLELGLPPQSGLEFLLPLNGRFTIWGDGAMALLQRSELVEDYKVEWLNKPENWDKEKSQVDLKRWPPDYGVRVSIKRRGQASPYVGEFTVGDAIRAGLWNSTYRKPWINSPERMLLKRANAFPMRDGFADALMGLGITEEVLDSLPAQGDRRREVDNSMLDDDLPLAGRTLTDQSKGTDIAALADEYIAGLATIDNLEALTEYQAKAEHRSLIAGLQDSDERLYQKVIHANAHRYQEIEKAEQDAARARDEAEADAESESDAEGADAKPETDGQQGDLLGDGK